MPYCDASMEILNYVYVCFGIALLYFGGEALVNHSVVLARSWGVSTIVVGLTVVASSPELATSLIAALQGSPELAIGNVIGSNIFNILGILGIAVLVSPMSLPWESIQRDMWVMLGASLLLWPFVFTGRQLSRLEGGFFLLGYTLYLYVLIRLIIRNRIDDRVMDTT